MKIKLAHKTYNDCHISFGKYHNNRPVIVVTCQGQQLLRATVNISEAALNLDQVLIKNWSENKGILQSLIEANVIEDTGKTISTGYVEANICNLLPGAFNIK